ncbi:MAG: hypothetical protein K9J17_06780 [Flavobacteriales bacterium]|nr:hypothetical protein [Flavobacteriales bacterium]
MVELTELQVELIDAYIKENGVAQSELQENLLDHLCTSIETQLQQGKSFEEAFQYTINLFGPGGLKQVQTETFKLLTEMNAIMKKVTFGFGLTSTFLLLAGTIFKLMHWPGANIMVLLGAAFLALVYLPLILTHKLKESPKDEALLHILGFLGLAITTVGVLFKILHWPGAAVILLSGMCVLAFGYVPVYFFKRYQTSANRPVTLSSSMIAVACLILILALMKTGNSIYYEHGVMVSNENLTEQTQQLTALNAQLYTKTSPADLANLKDESDQLVNHLEGMKKELIAWAAQADPLQLKISDIYQMDKKHDMAISHDLLLGPDDAPNNGRFSASELEDMFAHYRTAVLHQYPPELRSLMDDNLGLRTDGSFSDAQGQPQSWGLHQFEYTPLFTVITNITNWQLEIRQMENQVLLSKISRPEASNPPS